MLATLPAGQARHDAIRLGQDDVCEEARQAAHLDVGEILQAEVEAAGLHRVLEVAGVEWRLPGCSLCVGANGETVPAGQRCVSTSNRNFVGRQGKDSRTHLASPAMAAAAAVTGQITDVRKLMD